MENLEAKNELAQLDNNAVIGMDTVNGFHALMKQAQLLAASDIIPVAFQKKPANVLIACNMAIRMHADPLSVMQNLYIVYGNPSFSSKFLIGTFNTCGRFTSIKYEFFGKKGTDTWGCRAYCTELATGEKIVGPDVDIKMSKDEGWYTKKASKWVTMPQVMLQYRSAAFLIRTTAPELSLGLTAEEYEDIDMQPNAKGTYVSSDSVEATAAKVDQQIAAAPVEHITVASSAKKAPEAKAPSFASVPNPAPAAPEYDAPFGI